MALLEERKKKLAAEGLFAEERKRALPFMPRVVGIVTSPTGAVIRDMMHGFRERFPVHVIVWPVRVQGETSAREIAAGIEGFNRLPKTGGGMPRPDVLIVARGGGSLEDLWSFNEEIVVRAAAGSDIPLISAVGHETDWTLIDYAADARAPTPTKAAEWAVPKYSELQERMGDLRHRQLKALRRGLDLHKTHLKSAARGLPRLIDLVGIPRQRLDAASMRLAQGLTHFTRSKRQLFERFDGRLQPHLLSLRVARGRERVTLFSRSLEQHIIGRLRLQRQSLNQHGAGLRPQAIFNAVVRGRRSLTQLNERQGRVFSQSLILRRKQVAGLGQLLQSLSYQSALKRGFVLVRDAAGEMLRHGSELKAGARVELEFSDGRVWAAVEGANEKESEGEGDAVARSKNTGHAKTAVKSGVKTKNADKPAKAKRSAELDDKQGSLF
jgi:exodeoxyribonuclease VII large subunit